MGIRIHARLRMALVALGVFAGFCATAAATPLAGASRTAVAPANASTTAVPVHYRGYNRNYCYRYGNCRGYNRYRNDDWRYRRYYRRPYRNLYVQPWLYYGPPAYRYVEPRRYYRGGGSAHVRWCYNRYRSYRAWDNTYQPYHGPRRQCWSPYS
ncbi:BA14K family protein [Mesorhizobium sp. ZMM04-5]|uniref:Lectin-like protein BA14k n=1 Tax=Mesorhizobium marinum TaxID=3228790 RepID=A0ABV3QVW8_9HYPH